MLELFKRFNYSTGGNVALIAAIAMPAFLGAAALTVDYTSLHNKKSVLQQITDSAAIAAAKELQIASATDSQIHSVAKATVFANITATGGSSKTAASNVKVATEISEDRGGLRVIVKERWTPFFAHYFGSGVTPVVTEATANLLGDGAVCVVGLMDYSYFAAVHLDDDSKLLAEDCGIYSNSQSKYSFRVDRRSEADAESICTAGGFLRFGSGARINPIPTTDCPRIPDPLIDRPTPVVKNVCHETNLEISSNRILMPGVYCGGLKVFGAARVKLQPGVYVIKDGPLLVMESAQMIGVRTGFYLTGEYSTLYFAPDTSIDLSAPETGPLAGLLFFEDRDTPYDFSAFKPLQPELSLSEFGYDDQSDGVRLHRISSNNARQLLGTFYMPNSILLIDSNAPVADHSAYTAIIVARLWLKEGPTLVLNSDYPATNVPVPEGLLNGKIALSE